MCAQVQISSLKLLTLLLRFVDMRLGPKRLAMEFRRQLILCGKPLMIFVLQVLLWWWAVSLFSYQPSSYTASCTAEMFSFMLINVSGVLEISSSFIGVGAVSVDIYIPTTASRCWSFCKASLWITCLGFCCTQQGSVAFSDTRYRKLSNLYGSEVGKFVRNLLYRYIFLLYILTASPWSSSVFLLLPPLIIFLESSSKCQQKVLFESVSYLQNQYFDCVNQFVVAQ